MRALVAGWFSFEDMGATAGDLLARDVVCEWLEEAGIPYDVAVAKPFEGGIDWRATDPEDYTYAVFVCGPFGNGRPATDFLEHFQSCTRIGIDLTLIEPAEDWNPFDILIERDSLTTANPDLSLAAKPERVPVIGVIEVHDQPLPGARHGEVRAAIDRLMRARPAAWVRIDTRLDEPNSSGLRTPAEIEALIARMDAVVTMRMHGLVLALKHGVPALALDPITGGHKVTRQASALGWDIVLRPEELTNDVLQSALERSLSPEARQAAAVCAQRGLRAIDALKQRFMNELSQRVQP